MTPEAERLATAFETGDYTIYEIKAAAAILRKLAAKIEQMKSNAPPEGSIRAVRDYRCTCGKVVSFPIDSEITKADAEIARLREREADAWRHAEILSIRLHKSETSLRLMEKTCNKLDDTIEVEDTLLRQALEALEKTRTFRQQDWSSEETTPKLTRDTIAAIKQHLGEDHGN